MCYAIPIYFLDFPWGKHSFVLDLLKNHVYALSILMFDRINAYEIYRCKNYFCFWQFFSFPFLWGGQGAREEEGVGGCAQPYFVPINWNIEYMYIPVLDNIKRIYCRKQLCIIFLIFFVTRSALGKYFISVHKATRFSDNYRDKKWDSGWKLVYYSYFELLLVSELCIMEIGSKTSQINPYIHMGDISYKWCVRAKSRVLGQCPILSRK